MRFRARVQRAQFGQLHTFIKSLSELGAKTALLYLAADSCKAIVKTDADSLLLWGTLRTDATFQSFTIESKAGNVIGIEVNLPNLLHALKSGPSAEAVQLKLTKRGSAPYLCIETLSIEGGVAIVQDVPVRVLSAADLARYGEPTIPNPTVRLVLPQPRSMLAVTERMRATSGALKHLTLSADSASREVSLAVVTPEVSIRTFYRGVVRDEPLGGEEEAADSQGGGARGAGAVSVAVPIRDFGRVLRAVANMSPPPPASPTNALLLVCAGSALVVHAPLHVASESSALEVGDAVGALTFIISTANVATHDD